MPWKAKHPCAHPGCKELTHKRFCEQHQAKANADYDKTQRDPTMKRFYNSPQWFALRSRKLYKDPLCEECKKGGTLIKATVVDHIHEMKHGGDALAMENLQSLCWSCHAWP